MQENLRDIARRLIASYRLKRGVAPCRLDNEKGTEGFAHGAAIAQGVQTAAPEQIAERLADDPAFLFDMVLTDKDIVYLRCLGIDQL